MKSERCPISSDDLQTAVNTEGGERQTPPMAETHRDPKITGEHSGTGPGPDRICLPTRAQGCARGCNRPSGTASPAPRQRAFPSVSNRVSALPGRHAPLSQSGRSCSVKSPTPTSTALLRGCSLPSSAAGTILLVQRRGVLVLRDKFLSISELRTKNERLVFSLCNSQSDSRNDLPSKSEAILTTCTVMEASLSCLFRTAVTGSFPATSNVGRFPACPALGVALLLAGKGSWSQG